MVVYFQSRSYIFNKDRILYHPISDYNQKKNIKPYQQLKSIDALLNNMDLLVLELYGSQIDKLDNAPDWAQDPFIDKEILSQLFKNAKSAKNSVTKRGNLSNRVETMLGELIGHDPCSECFDMRF